jgi:hypothetical protein
LFEEKENKMSVFEIIDICSECDEGEEAEGIPCACCGGIGYLSTIKKYRDIKAAKKSNPFSSSIYECDEEEGSVLDYGVLETEDGHDFVPKIKRV